MKKAVSFVLALALAVSVSACGNAGTPTPSVQDTTVQSSENSSSEESSSESAEESAESIVDSSEADPNEGADSDDYAVSYPVTVTDQIGREVTFESAPEKIVSGYYISTGALIALGVEDRLVGIESKADKRAIYKLAAPELIELPAVGTLKEFDLEACIATEPELVILAKKQKDSIEALENLGIKVLVVNPENGENVVGMLELFAEVTDSKERCEEVLNFIAEKEDYLNEKLAGAEAPTVYFAGNSDLLSTAPGAMYQSGLVALAGGANVAADVDDTYWVEIGYEQLLAWNPDVIIMASDAAYTVEDVLADANLATVTAVVNGAVYKLPSDVESWDSPVPSSILGALFMASKLHPELVSEADYAVAAKDYYEKFYGFTIAEN